MSETWKNLRGLFSSYFLTEGAPGLADYHAIDDAEVAALGATIADRIAVVMAMRAPNEAQTESELIAPVLDALGWRDFYTVQPKVQRARADVPDYLLFISAAEKSAAGALGNVGDGFKHGVTIVEAKSGGCRWIVAAGALGEGVPSNQILRYRNNVEVASNRRIRFGVLTTGRGCGVSTTSKPRQRRWTTSKSICSRHSRVSFPALRPTCLRPMRSRARTACDYSFSCSGAARSLPTRPDVAAHGGVGLAGHHHRQYRVVRDAPGHRQDIVLPAFHGLHHSHPLKRISSSTQATVAVLMMNEQLDRHPRRSCCSQPATRIPRPCSSHFAADRVMQACAD